MDKCLDINWRAACLNHSLIIYTHRHNLTLRSRSLGNINSSQKVLKYCLLVLAGTLWWLNCGEVALYMYIKKKFIFVVTQGFHLYAVMQTKLHTLRELSCSFFTTFPSWWCLTTKCHTCSSEVHLEVWSFQYCAFHILQWWLFSPVTAFGVPKPNPSFLWQHHSCTI